MRQARQGSKLSLVRDEHAHGCTWAWHTIGFAADDGQVCVATASGISPERIAGNGIPDGYNIRCPSPVGAIPRERRRMSSALTTYGLTQETLRCASCCWE